MTAGAAGVRYAIDPRASQFTVQAFASGLISAIAHSPKIAIRDWTGVAEMASAQLERASLKVRVKTSSLEVLDELPDSERSELHRVMRREVLETERYPEVAYDAEVAAEKMKDDQYRLRIHGRLGLHGVSHEQDVVAQAHVGVDSVRVHGSFTLLQSDYNIRIASIAGGTLKLQDELKFYFYVVARKMD